MPRLVLVVHDFWEVRQEIWAALTETGFRVLTNADPLAAVDTINKYAPRALITRSDFGPGRLSGEGLGRMCKFRRKQTPVVFVAHDAEEEIKAGTGEVFRTPLHLTNLVASVHRGIFQPQEHRASVRPFTTCPGPVIKGRSGGLAELA